MTTTHDNQADIMTNNLTAFALFADLVAAGLRGYSPTLRGSEEAAELARRFDNMMALRGCQTRAFQR